MIDRDLIAEMFGVDLLFADGFDDCILGIVERCGDPPVVAYDSHKILMKLSKEMTLDDAQEYFDHNILGSFVGELTPAFITPLCPECMELADDYNKGQTH